MKKIFLLTASIIVFNAAQAQNWLTTGNSGLTTSNFLGTTDNHDIIFKANGTERGRLLNGAGAWRFGNATNFAKIDSAGKLTFGGTGTYLVAGNKYAFQYSAAPNYGLFFNSTNVQYEFRDGSALPIFSVNANTGDGNFNGNISYNGSLYSGGLRILGNTVSNTYLGLNAGKSNTIGYTNVFLGDSSGLNNTSGHDNAFLGRNSGLFNVDGSGNTFLGNYAGAGNISGTSNVTVGGDAGNSLTTGSNNVLIGSSAGYNNGASNNNTAVGYRALSANTSGYSNVAIGINALKNNTAGNNLVAVGDSALYSFTGGFGFNTAIGTKSLFYNTTGSENTAIGANALYNNTTGLHNTAVGNGALYKNITGQQNTGLGTGALADNISGYGNTALGDGALSSNTTGGGNTATGLQANVLNTSGHGNTSNGYAALYLNTSGGTNIATGIYALYNNTTGYSNVAIGASALYNSTVQTNIVAIGDSALYNNSGSGSLDGLANVAVGSKAMYTNNTGRANSGLGFHSLYANTTGSHNTGLGYFAGNLIVTGNDNTYLGYNANTGSTSISNSTAIGSGATVNNSNNFVFGNSSVSKWGFGQTVAAANIIDFSNTTAKLTTGGVWTNASDKKLKTNFQQLDKKDILDKIAKLDIQRWHYIADGQPVTHIGPIAQDFYAAFKVGDDTTISTIDPAGVALLGIQQLTKENDALKEEINALKTIVQTLQQNYNNCSPCGQQSALPNEQNITINGKAETAKLEQNIPNPFSNTTTINYSLPPSRQDRTSAKIIITDKNGKVLKEVTVSGSGKGSVQIDAAALSSGAYQYSLYVDGRLIDTKQMEHIK